MKSGRISLLVACMIGLGSLPVRGQDGLEARLDRGEIFVTTKLVEKFDTDEVTVQAVIDTGPEKLWEVVSQCNTYQKIMPRIAASQEIRRQDGKIICQVTADLPWPLSDLTSISVSQHTVAECSYKRDFHLLGGDYYVNEGGWELTCFKGNKNRTLATYRILVIPKSGVPGWLREKGQKSVMPDMILALRKHFRVGPHLD